MKTLFWMPIFFALTLASCQRDSITSIWVPKEEVLPASGTLPNNHPQISWTLPEGWVEQPLADMRIGSFLAQGPNGQNIDISVVSIPGGAGGLLLNINRWRGQIQLPPIDEKDLAGEVTLISAGPGQMNLVDFSNSGKRITAAVIDRQGQSWFFKMTGEDEAVQSILPAFKKFLSGLQFNEK